MMTIAHYGAAPQRAHVTDAGYDLTATNYLTLHPGNRGLAMTSLHISIPQGYAGLVVPRSGLALKHGVTVLNAPGVIDPGFTGEVGVILHNTDHNRSFIVYPGDRVAQLVLVKLEHPEFVQAESLADLKILADQEIGARGDGGFGSTGVSATPTARAA